MSAPGPRPCRKPQTDVAVWVPNPDLRIARCLVPACEWESGPSVKTHVDEMTTWHRRAHRDAVPLTRIERALEWNVYCSPCGGHRRTLGTRREAAAWLDQHLTTEHGLVVCP